MASGEGEEPRPEAAVPIVCAGTLQAPFLFGVPDSALTALGPRHPAPIALSRSMTQLSYPRGTSPGLLFTMAF